MTPQDPSISSDDIILMVQMMGVILRAKLEEFVEDVD